MSQRTKFALGLVVATAVAAVVLFSNGAFTFNGNSSQNQNVEPPIDVALDFYFDWLDARSSSTERTVVLPALSQVTSDFASVLTQQGSQSDVNAVLCMSDAVSNVVGRVVSETQTTAEMMVYDRAAEGAPRAIVALIKTDEAWLIDGVNCSNGDVAPPAPEFTFEQTGNLLKESIIAPFDSQRWHLVYTKGDLAGNVIPLYFSVDSQCTETGGSTDACDTNQFTEPQEVTIKGQMVEAGVEVQIVEL